MFIPSNPLDTHQTNIEYEQYQREIDKKTDDFPVIRLSKEERKLLNKFSKFDIQFDKLDEKNRSRAKRLQSLNLIQILGREVSVSKTLYFCKIRERGVSYLRYINDESAKSRKDRAHDWKIAVFTAIAGALLSKPIWTVINQIVEAFSK